MRASDRSRDVAAARLRAAYVDGALSTNTFEVRLESALRARSASQLERLTGDLPSAWRRFVRRLQAIADDLTGQAEATDVALPVEPGGSVRIGRNELCDVVLEDRWVSRQHVEIRRVAGGWQVVDLDSRNGTICGGRRVERAEVFDGDVLWLGASAVRLRDARG